MIDAVGMETTRSMSIRAVRPGGVLMHIGLQHGSGDCDFRKITLSEITVIGTYTYTHRDLQAALQKSCTPEHWEILHGSRSVHFQKELPLSQISTVDA